MDHGGMTDILPRRALEEIGDPLRGMLEPMTVRLGYFGEMLQFLSHSEPSLGAFLHYSAALKDELPLNLVEVIALTVSARMGFYYERIQHERLALKCGFDRDWIAGAIGSSAEDPLSPLERLVSYIACSMVAHRYEAAQDGLRRLVDDQGPGVAAAALFQITRQISIGLMGRILEPHLPVPSIFESAHPDNRRNGSAGALKS